MSLPRLPFLYPFLFNGSYTVDSYVLCMRHSPTKSCVSRARHRQLHNIGTRQQDKFPQRYGPALEPIPFGSGSNKNPGIAASNLQPAPEKLKDVSKTKKDTDTTPERRPESSEKREGLSITGTEASNLRSKELTGAHSKEPQKSLDTVLHMQASTPPGPQEQKHSHLHAPLYVHHFDTYTLVRDLEKGGFTQDQSVTMMKAVRSLLAINMDVAKEELVSKSDIANGSYLFQAACSELRTEIQNSRKSANEKMRTERAMLQHEVDLMGQRLTQESLTLKDDLRGMFNDRKMAVRMEQRAMESAIQELNYKITVALNSDSKGEVEGLRWVLTRRAAMAIVSMAILILGSLRYSSYMIHMQGEERKRMNASSSSPSGPGSTSYPASMKESGTQTRESDLMLANMDSGSNPAYVSLG